MQNITDQYRSLFPGDLHIALGEVAKSVDAGQLSETEDEEYRSIGHERRKNEFLSTRGLIKKLAADLGLSDHNFEIHKDALGKPYGVYGDERYELSLAHTGRKIVGVLSSGMPVGVDIEPEDRQVMDRLRDRILNKEEQSLLQGQPLIRIWTLKEALVKLNGRGLRTNLNDLRLRPINNHLFSGLFSDEKTARICSFRHQKYWIAIAYYHH